MLDILTMLLVEVIEEVIRKMYLTQIEHKRILWIKQVLQDNNIPIYQGHNSKTKKR